MKKTNRLEDIDFSKYEVDREKGIYSKHKKIWVCGDDNKYGYNRISMVLLNGGKKQYGRHRVMAYCFIDKPEELKDIPYEDLEVDHINGDKTDNRIENLRWTDCKGNMNNPITKKRKSEALRGVVKGFCNPLKPVEQWSKDGTTLIARYESMNEAARQTGINCPNISTCCQGRRQSAGGYKWRYAD